MVAMALWIISVIDALTTIMQPPGLFSGKFYLATLMISIGGPVIFFIYQGIKNKKRKKDFIIVEKVASKFELQREREIRKILQNNPEFATHCYECIHFDSNLLYCSRKRSERIYDHRLKEMTINNRKFCLYWELPAPHYSPGVYPDALPPQTQETELPSRLLPAERPLNS